MLTSPRRDRARAPPPDAGAQSPSKPASLAAPGGPDLSAFYLACADYLVWSMDRLHEQDQIIHDLLGERISATEKEAHERLAVLNARQRSSRELMAGFERDAAKLRTSGPAASPRRAVRKRLPKIVRPGVNVGIEVDQPERAARRASARSSGSVML